MLRAAAGRGGAADRAVELRAEHATTDGRAPAHRAGPKGTRAARECGHRLDGHGGQPGDAPQAALPQRRRMEQGQRQVLRSLL